ncbi:MULTISPECIES: hypothetical protein [unclassified Pseudoalteromonas]|uniref:hypothetical protein n=1 Tax=unclassified Pseudoalteromonas TaxID=194690 RepID=UPI0005AA75C1|nr:MULTISPECIES: hypothetical protein [unclassified Pseudoalteromonas]
MTKSIETIWKNGFVNEPSLTAPKINNLYDRKSQNIVDKLRNMFSQNLKAIVLGSIFVLIMMSINGLPFLGIYLFCLMLPLMFIAKRELNKSVNLSKGQSSYDYIMNFNNWLNSSMAAYAQYYKVFYPLLFIGLAVQGIVSEDGSRLIAQLLEAFPTDIIILGLPYYLLIGLIIVTLIVARFAEALYRFDLNIIYGRQFKKLEELIADMEELRK